MTYARAIIRIGAHSYNASLGVDGWRSDAVEVEYALNTIAHPSRFGPADGDPMHCAAEAARVGLGAETEVSDDLEVSPGRVY